MITSTIKARRNYNPLTVACSIKLAADSASLSQIYDTDRTTYSPDRTKSDTKGWLKLQPSVTVYAVDGSVQPVDIMNKDNQTKITAFAEAMTMEWQTTSNPSTEASWTALTNGTNCSIDSTSTSATFGLLTYKANLTAGTKLYFRFKCSFTDKRRGVEETVYSDPICSECVEKALDEVRLYTEDNLNILYNPFFDANTTDIYFCLKRGKEKIAFDTTRYNLYVKTSSGLVANISGVQNADGYLTKCTTASHNSLTHAQIHIFNGMGTDKKDYIVQLVDKQKGNRIIDTRYISLQRLFPTFDIINTNHAAFEPNKKRNDSCIVTSCRKRVTNPANYLTIDWYVYDASGSAVKKATGESVTLDLTTSGFSTLTEGFDMYFNVDYETTIGTDNI